jgi:FtsH-binding integral membrane protein
MLLWLHTICILGQRAAAAFERKAQVLLLFWCVHMCLQSYLSALLSVYAKAAVHVIAAAVTLTALLSVHADAAAVIPVCPARRGSF